MKRLAQHPVAWCVAATALAVVLAAGTPPLPGQATAKLPVVEPPRHKSYTEAIPGSDVKFEMVAS